MVTSTPSVRKPLQHRLLAGGVGGDVAVTRPDQPFHRVDAFGPQRRDRRVVEELVDVGEAQHAHRLLLEEAGRDRLSDELARRLVEPDLEGDVGSYRPDDPLLALMPDRDRGGVVELGVTEHLVEAEIAHHDEDLMVLGEAHAGLVGLGPSHREEGLGDHLELSPVDATPIVDRLDGRGVDRGRVALVEVDPHRRESAPVDRDHPDLDGLLRHPPEAGRELGRRLVGRLGWLGRLGRGHRRRGRGGRR